MKIHFKRLDHVQICIPEGKEIEARRFYCDVLQLEEIDKPEYLKKNGGFWLKIADIQLHIGVEASKCKSKRHPAFEIVSLDDVKRFLEKNGVRIKEDLPIPGFRRFSFYDPFDNRIELVERISEDE